MKTKILIAYPSMMMGGSTTSLIALLNAIDKERYEIDLQLYRHEGELFRYIPSGVNLLPPAAMPDTKVGRVIKIIKTLFSGYLFRAYFEGVKTGKRKPAAQVLVECQARVLSRRNKMHYDIAIGYLEGWPDNYIAHRVKADKKYGWLHSTFENLAPIPHLEFAWMRKVDRVVFVTDACREAFCKTYPEFADKAVTIANIVDSQYIRERGDEPDLGDEDYLAFRNADAFKIVTVCRIAIYTKGLDRIIRCAKRLKKEGVSFCWCVVGGGSELGTFRDMIRRAGLTDCLFAIGTKLNPYPFVKAADVYCMPSRYEGKPMTVTESMMLGVPPFVTEYLSAREQICDGVEGVVAPNGDSTMVDALLPYLQDPSKLKDMHKYLLEREYGNIGYMKTIETMLLN